MNKTKHVWQDFVNNFFSRRLLFFCVFQFYILHYYINSVKRFSVAADYPAYVCVYILYLYMESL